MPTLEEMAATPHSGLSLEDMATTAKGPEVSQFDSFDDQQKARIRNALLYSGMSNRLPGEVYDYTSGINQQIYGSPDEVTAWKKNIGIIKETKSWGEAVEHGLIVAGNQMNKTMKEAGWMVADLDQQFWNWAGARQPEILKRWDEEAFELKREMDAYLEMFYKEHPEQLAETAPGTGYLEKALWYTENPKVVLQNAIQSAPITLLGGFGKVAGLGTAGMIALFGGPTVAETYTEARAEGTEITPALAQALLTGGGEGAIEEWTFGRKIGIAQNFSKIVKGGFPKIAWEALKAYGRGTAEEGGQQANRNFWRFIFTDANQKISEGVADAAAAGGPVELLMAGVFGMGGYTIQKTGALVDQAEQHRRLNIIEGEIQKSQNFTDEQKAEISQEIDSVRQDVDSGVYLPEEEAKPPSQAVEKAPVVPVAGQTAEIGAVEPTATGVQTVPPAAGVAAAKAGPGAEAKAWESAAMAKARAIGKERLTRLLQQKVTAGVLTQEKADSLGKKFMDAARLRITEGKEPAIPVVSREVAPAAEALGKGEGEKAEAAEPGAKPLEMETDLDKLELPSVTSARQAMIAEGRTALGLDEIASPDRKAWKESLSKAKEKGYDENALRIASEVNVNPRSLDDEETAGLVIKAARLKNEYKGLMDKLNHTKDKGEIQGLAAQADRVEAEFDSLSRAIHISGTEKGRALASQKLTINQDYDLISVVTRAKAAKGKELSTAERTKFTELTGKLDTATAQIDDLQRQIAEMAASSGIRKEGLKRYNRMSLEQKDTQLNSLVSRVNELLKQGCY